MHSCIKLWQLGLQVYAKFELIFFYVFAVKTSFYF